MPSLPPLITAADLTAYGYDLAAATKIPSASARVRRVTGQLITAGTSTTTLWGPGPWRMPQRPVTALVTVIDSNGNDAAATLQGQWLHSDHCAPLVAEYAHGFDPLPDELIELVCSITARLASIPDAMAAGVRTEQAGGESITWGADGWAGTTGLTRPEMEALRRIYPKLPKTTMLVA